MTNSHSHDRHAPRGGGRAFGADLDHAWVKIEASPSFHPQEQIRRNISSVSAALNGILKAGHQNAGADQFLVGLADRLKRSPKLEIRMVAPDGTIISMAKFSHTVAPSGAREALFSSTTGLLLGAKQLTNLPWQEVVGRALRVMGYVEKYRGLADLAVDRAGSCWDSYDGLLSVQNTFYDGLVGLGVDLGVEDTVMKLGDPLGSYMNQLVWPIMNGCVLRSPEEALSEDMVLGQFGVISARVAELKKQPAQVSVAQPEAGKLSSREAKRQRREANQANSLQCSGGPSVQPESKLVTLEIGNVTDLQPMADEAIARERAAALAALDEEIDSKFAMADYVSAAELAKVDTVVDRLVVDTVAAERQREIAALAVAAVEPATPVAQVVDAPASAV